MRKRATNFPAWYASYGTKTWLELNLIRLVQDTPIPSLQRADSEVGTKKLAIPRLAEGADSAFTSPGRFHRRHVRRACESCRQRKTKCTGDKSGCRNCREAGIICCYTDGKREKSKRSADTLTVGYRYV